MSYRSWLKDVTVIYDLGSHCAPRNPLLTEKDWERDDLMTERWIERLKRPIPVETAFQRFFGSGMHDSWVLSTERTPEQFRIRLDCHSADIFACALSRVLSLAQSKTEKVIELIAEDALLVRWLRMTPEGKMLSCRHEWAQTSPEKLATTEKFSLGLDTFMYDWFENQENRVQWIVMIRTETPKSRRLDSNLYILVDGERVYAEDHRLSGFIQDYGPSVQPVWEDALQSTEDIWYTDGMAQFISHRLAHHSLTASDFSGGKLS